DEFYLKAKRAIPSAEYYEDFPQIENGVGMVRTFVDNFLGELQRESPIKHTAAVDIATGEAFFPIMSHMAKKACDKLGDGLKIKVHCVKNNFFGGNVNVTALLTGQDLIEGLKGKLTSERLLLCRDILRSEGDMLLDDTTPQDIEKALSTKIEFYSNDGCDLLPGIVKEVR
ncbi:MAG: DUF512 domain-containing protein, partial [Oscillospiraceae bacterium]